MDIGKSFSYPFEDNDWLSKLFIGALVSAVPILNFAWLGYIVDLLRNVMDGASLPLPDWSDFGDKFVKGLLLWLASIIYSLPALIVACIPLGFLLVSSGAQGSDAQDVIGTVFTGIGLVLGCIFIIYALVLSFFLPAVVVNFARKGTFGSCFEFGAITKIVTANTSRYLTAWLISIVAAIVVGIIISLVGSVLSLIPCVGWVIGWVIGAIGGVYISTIFVHLFGQVAATQMSSPMTTEM
jgi:Protein of unknown function (DUF4013)